MKLDWAAREYFKSGVDVANLLTVAVGPIDVPAVTATVEEDEMLGFSAKSVPEFIAGFLYGWTGDNNLTEVEACFTSDRPIVKELKNATEFLLQGDLVKALALFDDAYKSLEVAMMPCHNMSNDLAALKAWGATFTQTVHLAEVVATHFAKHRVAIK